MTVRKHLEAAQIVREKRAKKEAKAAAAPKCAAWDGGAIAEQFKGWIPDPKTTKTRCGKRAAFRTVDNQNPTCPQCIADIAREKAGLAAVMQYARENGHL